MPGTHRRLWLHIVGGVLAILLAGGLAQWLIFGQDDTTDAATPSAPVPSAGNGLSNDRLSAIEGIINKQEAKDEKLKSQAAVMVPSLRENFAKQGTPIENITFGDDINTEGPRATVSATGASGTQYAVVLVYVPDPASSTDQWLILYAEAK